MATFTTYTYGSSGWDPGDAEYAVAFLNSLNCPLITVELLSSYNYKITFENGVILKAYGYGNPGSHLAIIDDGFEVSIADMVCAKWGTKTLTVIYSDSLFYIRFNNTQYTGQTSQFLYEHIDNKQMYGYSYGSNADFADKSLTFTDYISKTIYQRNIKFLTYSVESGNIDYMDHSGFFAVSDMQGFNQRDYRAKEFDDSLICACTTINRWSKILVNGELYYSMSPNLLIPLDSED